MPQILANRNILSLPTVSRPERIAELLEDLAAVGDTWPDPEIGEWARNTLTAPQIGELLGPVLAVSPFLRRCARFELSFLMSVFELGPDTALIEITDEIKDELIHELTRDPAGCQAAANGWKQYLLLDLEVVNQLQLEHIGYFAAKLRCFLRRGIGFESALDEDGQSESMLVLVRKRNQAGVA